MFIEYVGSYFWGRIAGSVFGYREFIRLICFALVGKMLFKVFHRTLEFNLLLSILLITASFLAFSISLTTLFLAILKDTLWIRHFSGTLS